MRCQHRGAAVASTAGDLNRTPDPVEDGRALAPVSTRALLLLSVTTTAWSVGGVARAADVGDISIGVGAGVAFDLPDRASTLQAGDPVRTVRTGFGPGPLLRIPFRWQVAPLARVRVDADLSLATGQDVVTWTQQIDGEPVDFFDADHFTMALSAGLSVGADLFVPVGDALIAPYLGADLGGGWMGVYHSFGGRTQVLLDPEQNDLENPNNVDPYTSQAVFLSELHAGAEVAAGTGLAVWLEAGYSVAFVPARDLKKTPTGLNARREPFGYNAVRIAVGLNFSL